jgi:hypothetical protein
MREQANTEVRRSASFAEPSVPIQLALDGLDHYLRRK